MSEGTHRGDGCISQLSVMGTNCHDMFLVTYLSDLFAIASGNICY